MNFSRRQFLLSVSGGFAYSALAQINSAQAQVGLSPGLWQNGSGPYAITYQGMFQTSATSFTSGSISIGPAYPDRMVLVGITGNSTMTTISVGGVSATNLIASTYHCSWWRAVDVPGSSVTITGTVPSAYNTLYVYTVTGVSGGKLANLDPRQASANNTNSTAISYPASAIGDVFLAVGSKTLTGGTNAWGTLGGTSGVVQTAEHRIGTLGSGYGGHGMSPQQAATGSKTITTSGSDSSKPTTVAAVRISR